MVSRSANICGRRIRAKREALGFGQVELAAALAEEFGLQFTQSDISEIERGVRSVKDFELVAIAKELGVPTGWLLEEEIGARR